MADRTKIEWTQGPDGTPGATWNPIVGCSVVSPGCTNCYAMRLAGTRLRNHPSRAGLTIDSKAGPVWNGEVKMYEPALDQPLRWRRPRRIFVCAHGDLFHEAVPDEWIDRVFAVMALAPQHTFLVLTKRAARMRGYIGGDPVELLDRIIGFAQLGLPTVEGSALLRLRELAECEPGTPWPLPNVWLGVSVEDQTRADERIPDLFSTPAAKRFISAEPLLGPVDLRGNIDHDIYPHAIDWVIVGGESGPGARPMHPDLARSLRDQCAAASVPFFFKQWGEWLPDYQSFDPTPYVRANIGHRFPDNLVCALVGKKAAGRLLDGREHSEFPS